MTHEKSIYIKGARVHNLKNIEVEIPHDKLVVVTGLSGSGKSTLAFDTIFAEGQRRYVESLSAYARQFLGKINKPDVDIITGIAPAIAIEQKVNTRNPRSTVGTTTEIYDYLKLLYARIGHTFSPVSGQEVRCFSVDDVAAWILAHADQRVVIGAPLALGGSASNTIRAMARMGVRTGYVGKVGRDTTGDFFEQALVNLGIEPHILRGNERSGRCVSLVSADGERTMCTFLGAALEMRGDELNESLFDGYDCLYIEGYLVQDHELIGRAVRLAKACGLTVALDLASFNIVDENLGFLNELTDGYVDVLFANEQEAFSFTGERNPLEALDKISRKCPLAVVKVGTQGAYIKHRGKVDHVGIMAEAKRVDTTGAGDFYAAGFLVGLTRGLSMVQCGTIGAIAAGRVIEVTGTTLADETWTEIDRLIRRVEAGGYLF